ncbi:MAG TPA: apolipoprotein N-acyltransferase [Terriglobales bacterium]|nr:apolipoprotein N-acyltransferase [Terriglobales bacterium]
MLPTLAAGALSGLALGLVFPSVGWSWLAFIALVPLFWAVARGERAWPVFWSGYLAGIVFFAVSCSWIYATIHHFGDLSGPLAGVVFVLFLLLMGSYLALMALAAYWVGRWSGRRYWPLPFVWVAVELLRTYTPMGGFPWNLLGYSQYQHAGTMLLAPACGIYGVSLLVATANTLIAYVLDKPRRRGAIAAGIALGCIFGFATLPYHAPSDGGRGLHVRLVQPDTPLDLDWSGSTMTHELAAQARLSVNAATPPVDLIVWPEQPAPFDLDRQPELQQTVAEILDHEHSAMLIGEITWGASNAPRNSAQLVNADGTLGPRYDKTHLVPFGEYVPLPDWLKESAGVGKLVAQVGDFVPGPGPVVMPLGAHRFTTMICYESIFPALARRDVNAGAEWLVNQSDDSWYGQSSAAAQGLMMARVRAMENRRWLLRDTDDGITAVIDPFGRVTAQLARFAPGALDAGFAAESAITFYTRWGDWLAYLCLLAVLVLLLAGPAARAGSRMRRS